MQCIFSSTWVGLNMMIRRSSISTLIAVLLIASAAPAQNGYGIRGAGGLRANSIMGSGGLRGDSILGSGGLYSNSGGTAAAAANQRTFGGFGTGPTGTGGKRKPFSSYAPQPTVSPYLNLFRTDLGSSSGGLNYSTLVEPHLRQQAVNQSLGNQSAQQNRRLSSIA